jgi:hypothetical protein
MDAIMGRSARRSKKKAPVVLRRFGGIVDDFVG